MINSIKETSFFNKCNDTFKKVGDGIKRNIFDKFNNIRLKALDVVAPFNPVSKARSFRIIPTAFEKALGEMNYNQLAPAFKQVQPNNTAPNRANYYKIVNEVFDDLVNQSECRDKFTYEVRLIEDKMINAFCLPGGKTVITTGILDKINKLVNYDEKKLKSAIAFIMGHELTHANASHSVGSLTVKLMASFVGFIAGNILSIVVYQKANQNKEEVQQNLKLSKEVKERQKREVAERAHIIANFTSQVFKYIAAAFTYLMDRAVSRSHEYEADRHSLTYLHKAGYDFEGARITMKMFKEMRGKPNKFLRFIENIFSTHPSPDNRLKEIEKEITLLKK